MGNEADGSQMNYRLGRCLRYLCPKLFGLAKPRPQSMYVMARLQGSIDEIPAREAGCTCDQYLQNECPFSLRSRSASTII